MGDLEIDEKLRRLRNDIAAFGTEILQANHVLRLLTDDMLQAQIKLDDILTLLTDERR